MIKINVDTYSDTYLIQTFINDSKSLRCHQKFDSPQGKKLGFSHTQFYRKILALTDHTPSEFIRNIRLKMAAKMFHGAHRNITRVLYSVGFNTPAYFAQCFREVYGINPSEYIKQKELTR